MEINVLGLILKLIRMLTKLPTHNCKIFAKRPVLNQLKPVQTETGLSEPVWTGLDRSFVAP